MGVIADKLSLWEIAHRWHDVDPDHELAPSAMPLAVKDSVRRLAAEIHAEQLYSTLLLEREKRTWEHLGGSHKSLHKPAVSDFQAEFQACIENNVLDRGFLKSIMIPIWELEYWCDEYGVPFPAFWERSATPGLSSGAKPESNGGIDADGVNGSAQNRDAIGLEPVSEQHQQAAHARHEPVYALKREFVQFCLQHPGNSDRQLAERFYRDLSPEKQKSLAPSNAVVTLTRAMSAYRTGKDQRWLRGFKPT